MDIRGRIAIALGGIGAGIVASLIPVDVVGFIGAVVVVVDVGVVVGGGAVVVVGGAIAAFVGGAVVVGGCGGTDAAAVVVVDGGGIIGGAIVVAAADLLWSSVNDKSLFGVTARMPDLVPEDFAVGINGSFSASEDSLSSLSVSIMTGSFLDFGGMLCFFCC